MGTEDLHSEADEPSGVADIGSSSYDIISIHGSSIPENYEGLIYSRWLRSLRYGNFLFKMIDTDVYYEKQHAHITKILFSPDAEIRLAVLSDDHDVALGFCCHRGPILDYVHVHHSCRDIKIATHLTPDKIKCMTHWTYQGEKFATKKYGRWTYNPYA